MPKRTIGLRQKWSKNWTLILRQRVSITGSNGTRGQPMGSCSLSEKAFMTNNQPSGTGNAYFRYSVEIFSSVADVLLERYLTTEFGYRTVRQRNGSGVAGPKRSLMCR